MEAEKDLTLASAIAPADDAELQADIADALASLYRRQERFTEALQYAQQALLLREQLGNLPRIASSFNNLGIAYRKLGEYGHAIGAYEEALSTYQKLGNQEATAGALMNIGSAYFLMNRLQDAIRHYQQSLDICLHLGQPHVEATVRYNLAEAFAAMQHQAEALEHWQIGYDLSQRAGFADEVSAFEQLRAETPLLQASAEPQSRLPSAGIDATAVGLLPEEVVVMELAAQHGRITAKLLTEQLNVSRATATRRLSSLAEAGHLTQHGKGRGTYYSRGKRRSDTETRGSSHTEERNQPPTAATSALPLATATLLAYLADAENPLQRRFAVTAIEPASPPSAAAMPRLVVHFAETPTLAEFCALRAFINEVTGTEVDLWPAL
jgi:tetratricopeptide (TPR) repeat protein